MYVIYSAIWPHMIRIAYVLSSYVVFRIPTG